MLHPRIPTFLLVAGISLTGSAWAQATKAAAVAAMPAASGGKAAAVLVTGAPHGETVTEKLAACNAKAKAQHLKRKAKRDFMKDCAKDV
jgi:hypothetical protein